MTTDKMKYSALLTVIAAGIGGCPFDGRTGLPVDETSSTGGARGTSSAASTATANSVVSTAVSTTQSSTQSSAVSTTQSSAVSSSSIAGSSTSTSIRRPFLVGASLRSAGIRWRSDWQARPLPEEERLDPTTRSMLARAWLDDGIEEHASIAAFARWTMLMLSVGAPPDLVRESQLASLDEIEHAKACFSLAKRYGAGEVGPAELDLTGTVAPLSLVEIAVLTAEEGCAGETLGVAMVMEQEKRCEDPYVRDVLAQLVRDEQRHAWLTWAFIAWAVREGGPPVQEAVVGAIARATAATLASPLRTYDGISEVEWRRHGRLTCYEAREIVVEAEATVLRPAIAMLDERRC